MTTEPQALPRPVIDTSNPDAESLELRSVASVVDAAIAAATGEHI